MSGTDHRDGYARAEAWDERDDAWDDRAPRRPRRGVFGSAFSLLKLALFLAPLAFFLYGFVADCRARPTSGLLGFLGAGACARSEILGNAASMPDGLAVLKRLID